MSTKQSAAPAAAVQEPREAARERLQEHLRGWIPKHVVYAAARLRLADLLVAGPRPGDDLAAELGAHPDTLHRVLRAMVGMGLLTQSEDGRFALDEMGHLLRSDAPEPLVGRFIKDVELAMAWGSLLHTVRTGESPFEHVFGEHTFPRFARDPWVAALGAAAIPGTSWEVAQAIAAAYDFGRGETVVDVGGGSGIVLAAILQRYPHLRGAVLDQPHMLADASQVAVHFGVDSRVDLVDGDFFEEVPAGDVYVLKTILHDWDDVRAVRLLKRCRQAMRPGGRVLVVEIVLPERAVSGSGQFMGDMMMLVETGGRERTEREFRTIFAAAGFRLTHLRPLAAGTYAGRYLVEGIAAIEE